MQKELTVENLQEQINQAAESKPTPQKYDPSKAYKWEKDTIFTLSGTEFGIVHNFIRDFITGQITPIAIVKVHEAFNVLQSVLKKSVESGDSVEHSEQEVPTT